MEIPALSAGEELSETELAIYKSRLGKPLSPPPSVIAAANDTGSTNKPSGEPVDYWDFDSALSGDEADHNDQGSNALNKISRPEKTAHNSGTSHPDKKAHTIKAEAAGEELHVGRPSAHNYRALIVEFKKAKEYARKNGIKFTLKQFCSDRGLSVGGFRRYLNVWADVGNKRPK